MQLKLPLAYKLFKDTVEGVLTTPTKEYLDTLLFESLICGA